MEAGVVKLVPITCLPGADPACWMCHQDFDGDGFFAYVLRREGEGKRAWCTCLGCAATLACEPGNEETAELARVALRILREEK